MYINSIELETAIRIATSLSSFLIIKENSEKINF